MLRSLKIAVVFAVAVSAPAFAAEPTTDHERIAVLLRQVAALKEKVDQLEHTHGAYGAKVRKHAWPDLTEQQKATLTGVLKTLPKTTKFDIVCNDAACGDLAMDIDDAMEAAGLESVLDRSLGPLGYGIAVQVAAADKPAAEKTIAALKDATGGRLDLPLVEAPTGANAKGYVSILIGKYRAPANQQPTTEGR